jgi:SusD family.
MKKTIFFLIALLMMTLSSCNDYFDKTGDEQHITDKKFFGDEAAFASALTDCYTLMRSRDLYGGMLTLEMMEFANQNMAPHDAISSAAAQLNFADAALAARVDSMTHAAYRVVAACNKLIDEAERTKVVFTSAGKKKIITAEAYALRAAVQFDLLRLFHPAPATDAGFRGLPYVTHTSVNVPEALTTTQILQAVNDDLAHAAQLLKTVDPILKERNSIVGVGEFDRRLRTFQMNYYAVKAVQARVALWQGNYEQAVVQADSVLAHLQNTVARYRLFYWVTPGHYGSDFSFSREYVFGIASTPTGFARLSDDMFKTKGIQTTTSLRDIYADNADIRYRAWFRQQGSGYAMSNKFGSATLLTDYVYSTSATATSLPAAIPYIKLGEVMLIKAEALNEMGQTSAARSLLEEMQGYKDISYASRATSVTKESLRELIYAEARRDLFGEGQLFYLNKRLGLTSVKAADGTMRTVTLSQYTLPLPADLFNAIQ